MNDITATAVKPERVTWLDTAKALGIFLVFYGHYVEKFIVLKAPTALEQMNWIYAFHMPAFFLLSGLVYKRRDLGLGAFLAKQIRSRLAPVWAFNIIGAFIWLGLEWSQGESGWIHTKGWDGVGAYIGGKLFALFVYGRHGFNVLTWFLICLFVVELWQFLLRDVLKTKAAMFGSTVLFGAAAVLVSLNAEAVNMVLGARLHWWEFNTALMAMFFYQLGAWLKQVGFVNWKLPLAAQGALCIAFLAILCFAFNLNTEYRHSPAVPLMVDAGYGNTLIFMITSLSGTFFLIYLSQLFAFSRFLAYVGTITLSLMLLDGILHLYVNEPAAEWLMRVKSDWNVYSFTAMCIAATLASLAICWPVTAFFERFAPFLLGKPFPRKKKESETPGKAA